MQGVLCCCKKLPRSAEMEQYIRWLPNISCSLLLLVLLTCTETMGNLLDNLAKISFPVLQNDRYPNNTKNKKKKASNKGKVTSCSKERSFKFALCIQTMQRKNKKNESIKLYRLSCLGHPQLKAQNKQKSLKYNVALLLPALVLPVSQ